MDTDYSQDNSKIKRRFHRPVLIYLKNPKHKVMLGFLLWLC
ncbi:hypothetical protein AO366_1310 [Moraxella catarrhalis]|nr:hypothetical protein AO366_1310 [Moraxella catarrhalis]